MHPVPEPASAFIQGASSGIGLALTRQLLEDESFERVYASGRRARQSDTLNALRQEHGTRLVPVSLDLRRETDVARAADRVNGDGGRLHLLVNVAGLLHDNGMAPEKRLEDIQPRQLQRSFQVNAVGPLLMAKHFHRLLRHDERAVFASLSARVGSIEDNRLGGWYAYRGAKAAQNQFTRTLAIELRRRAGNCICLALHPGTVDTGLSRPFQRRVPERKLFSADFAAECLLKIIADAKPEDSGSFFAWDGQKIPW